MSASSCLNIVQLFAILQVNGLLAELLDGSLDHFRLSIVPASHKDPDRQEFGRDVPRKEIDISDTESGLQNQVFDTMLAEKKTAESLVGALQYPAAPPYVEAKPLTNPAICAGLQSLERFSSWEFLRQQGARQSV